MPNPPISPLLILAVVLSAGLAAGALTRKLRLPSVTGQILIGVLIGHAGLGLFEQSSIDALRPITEFALGMIAVAVGSHLHLPRLRNAGRRLFLLLLAETVFVPLFVFGALSIFNSSHWTLPALLAATSLATAPATTLAIIKETRSKGVFVKTLIAAVALNNMACIVLFEVAHGAARVALDPLAGHSVFDIWLRPLWQLAGSGLIGVAVGLFFGWATPLAVRWKGLPIASLIMILLTWGVASWLHVSPLLACMFLGLTLVNMDPHNEHLTAGPFEQFEPAILAAFFTVAGMSLELEYLKPAGIPALLVFLGRFAGKYMAANFSMTWAHATDRVRKYLGFALVPQAGIAVGLILVVQQDSSLSSIQNLFLAIGLAVVTLNELVGPILTRLSLVWADEMGKDRPRLIDFILEENIVTDFHAENKEEAIEKLTDLLIQSNHLDANRQSLHASIMKREEEMSTCIGYGLALPHGTLEGDRIVGAMAISREGLHFDTPDGKPVHCMVLLGTPSSQRDRHLEVLAAIARAITTSQTIKHELYSSKSPAHAYDLLHTEEAEDFNYFLEE